MPSLMVLDPSYASFESEFRAARRDLSGPQRGPSERFRWQATPYLKELRAFTKGSGAAGEPHEHAARRVNGGGGSSDLRRAPLPYADDLFGGLSQEAVQLWGDTMIDDHMETGGHASSYEPQARGGVPYSSEEEEADIAMHEHEEHVEGCPLCEKLKSLGVFSSGREEADAGDEHFAEAEGSEDSGEDLGPGYWPTFTKDVDDTDLSRRDLRTPSSEATRPPSSATTFGQLSSEGCTPQALSRNSSRPNTRSGPMGRGAGLVGDVPTQRPSTGPPGARPRTGELPVGPADVPTPGGAEGRSAGMPGDAQPDRGSTGEPKPGTAPSGLPKMGL